LRIRVKNKAALIKFLFMFVEDNINIASQEKSYESGRSTPHCRSPSTKLEGETLGLESGVKKHQIA
jgi:hypothetical protein